MTNWYVEQLLNNKKESSPNYSDEMIVKNWILYI